MSWITITEADVLQDLNEAEVTSYRQRVQADQVDPLAGIISDVTALVRGYVATRYPLATSGIPHGLKTSAIDIIIYRLSKRCQAGTEAQRKDAADDARSLLERVANGDHGIEDSTDPLSSVDGPMPSVTERTRYFDRDSQDGV